MALQGLKKWASGIAEHCPSFNDLNAFPEGHEEFAHKELDREANLSESSQASTTTLGSKRMSNKQDDDWPHMDHVVDYHKIEVADHTRDKRRLMDIPKEHNRASIWEHIVKSEEYMKGKLDPDTGKRLAREHGGCAEPAGPEAYTKPSPPLGLNPRAVLPGDEAKTAPEVVAERATQKKEMTPISEPPAAQIHSSKEDMVREVFEHYGSE